MNKTIVFLALLASSVGLSAQSDNPIGKQDDIVQGFARKISGMDFDYHSSLPDINLALLVRALDGRQSMEWETAPAPEKPKGKFVTFVWLGAVGSNLGHVQMDLAINGKPAFSFFTENRKSWDYESIDGSQLSFRSTLTDGPGDQFGFMFLRLPVKRITPGQPVRLAVTGSRSNSQAWYMTFQSKIPTGLSFKPFPALMKASGSLVQPVAVQVVWFGQPEKAMLTVNRKIYRTLDLFFGVHQFIIHIPAIEKATSYTFKLSSKGLSQEETLTLLPVRHLQVNFVQHTHTDIGYTRPQTEILAEHLRFIDYALEYCDATDGYPDEARFRWTCENSYAVEQYLKTRPAKQVERLKRRIHEGRIEVTAMIFNFDEMPDEQTYAASLEPLNRFFNEGIQVKTAMQNDVNGFGWCFIDYFTPIGVRYINMGINNDRSLLPFDRPTAFWWESPSGNRVLAYRAEHYMIGNTLLGIHSQNFDYFESNLMNYLTGLATTDFPFDVIPLQHSGYQTDNSPPSSLACEMIRHWNEKYEWPRLTTATVSDFFNRVELRYSDSLPVFRAAWPDWWTDGYGTAAREQAAARQAKAEIIATQGALSIALLAGLDLPSDINGRIDEANRALLFYDEHTFGFAESVTAPLHESTLDQRGIKESYAWEAVRRIRTLGEETLGNLQSMICRDPSHPTLTVYNTLNWKRSGLIEVYIDHQLLPTGKPFRILAGDGSSAPAQASRHRSDGTYWNIWVTGIPPVGYKTYRIEVDHASNVQSVTTGGEIIREIDNPYYHGILDIATGTLSSLFDKELGVELIDPTAPWKMGQCIYERPANRMLRDPRVMKECQRYPPDTIWYEAHEKGPIWDVIRFKGETRGTVGPAGLVLEMRFFHTCKRLDLVYTIRKTLVSDPEAFYIAFPFSLKDGKIVCDVQGGILEPGVNQIPGSVTDWNSVQNFAAVRSPSGQILLSSNRIPLMQFGGINTGRYQYTATPASNHIYGWPMNNYWTTNFNADQRGELTFTYTVSSTPDNGNLAATRFGWGTRIPFPARILPPGPSNGYPTEASFLHPGPDNLLLINARPESGTQSVVLHIREVEGKATAFSGNQITTKKIVEISEVDVLGRPVGQHEQVIEFKPLETKFIRIKIKSL